MLRWGDPVFPKDLQAHILSFESKVGSKQRNLEYTASYSEGFDAKVTAGENDMALGLPFGIHVTHRDHFLKRWNKLLFHQLRTDQGVGLHLEATWNKAIEL